MEKDSDGDGGYKQSSGRRPLHRDKVLSWDLKDYLSIRIAFSWKEQKPNHSNVIQ